jgi:hypothetical protein
MHTSHEAETSFNQLTVLHRLLHFSPPLSLFNLHTLHFASLPSGAHVFRSYKLPRICPRLQLRFRLVMMASAQSMLAPVLICVVTNLVSAIAQFFRIHRRREIRIWWSRWDTPTWWSFMQVLCYIIGSIVTIVLWQGVPSVSNVALQWLLGVCWLNSLSGQVCHQVLQEG